MIKAVNGDQVNLLPTEKKLVKERDRVRRRKALGCPIWDIENKHAPACHFFCAIRSSRNGTMMHDTVPNSPETLIAKSAFSLD
jgi:hypothetical protein